jgi:hypothetical protein
MAETHRHFGEGVPVIMHIIVSISQKSVGEHHPPGLTPGRLKIVKYESPCFPVSPAVLDLHLLESDELVHRPQL